jgi:acyl-[acyl-carrier-protein]-phospholipid O-acyltransferase / long-chain-fatty-acid--[acyl-carrier-protein] ligase
MRDGLNPTPRGENDVSSAGVALFAGKPLAHHDLIQAKKTVFQALLDAREKFGGKRICLVDSDDRKLNYDEVVRAALALGHALKKGTAHGENVGIMLPTSAASLISFFAVSAFGRIPTMMNFTSGAAGMLSAMKTAVVQRVITARKFIELAKLEDLVAELSKKVHLVYLEDARANLGLRDKLAAGIGQFMPKLVASSPHHDNPGVILFTSGTEGEPKGVALSHRNVITNILQVCHHEAFYPHDIWFNSMPTFHCYGLVGALLGLFTGTKMVLHPTPLRPHEIVKRVKETCATIFFSTDTFMSQYGRIAEPGEFKTVRMAVCGAEKVRDETRRLLRKKHGLEVVEGYGLTECSPIVAAQQPGDQHPGTIGSLIPGMEGRIEPVEGIPGAGRLFVKGPNVMLGYIKPENPGVICPPEGGWHDTGDVVSIDETGIITIRGRLKRFANVGGETVSLGVVENCASSLWPDFMHAAVAVSGERKGEQIVLLTTHAEAKRADLLAWAQSHGVAELAVPRRILVADEIPVMGTGKPDYRKVEAIVKAEFKQA